MTEKISRSIFKAYDIRGIVDKTLTEEACEQIGQALGTLAHEKKVEKICVGRDGRLSGPRLQKALIKGIRKAGVGVYDIGAVPTPPPISKSLLFSCSLEGIVKLLPSGSIMFTISPGRNSAIFLVPSPTS